MKITAGMINGFADGLQKGIALGRQIKSVRNERAADKVREGAIEQAETNRQNDVNKQISVVQEGGVTGQQRMDGETAQLQQLEQQAVANAVNQPTAEINSAIQGINATQAPFKPAMQEQAEYNPNLMVNPDIASVDNAMNKPAPEQKPVTGEAPTHIAQTAGLGPIANAASNYQVRAGDQTFPNREEAQAGAGKNVKDKASYFAESVGPAMYQEYVRQGDIEKANAWRTYSDGERGRAAITDWSKGYKKLMSNDWDGGAKQYGQFYSDFIDDGVDYDSHTLLKDDTGNVTGFTLKLKNKASGKFSEVPLKKDELMQLAMMHNPQKMFEDMYTKQKETEKQRLTLAGEVAKEGRAELRDVKKDQRQHTYKVAENQAKNRYESSKDEADYQRDLIKEQHKSQLKANEPGETGKKIRDLKAAGIPDDLIQRAIAKSDSGVGDAPHPDRIAHETRQLLMKENPSFDVGEVDDKGKPKRTPYNKMTQAQKNKIVADESSLGKQTPAPVKPAEQKAAHPAAGGIVPAIKPAMNIWYPDSKK